MIYWIKWQTREELPRPQTEEISCIPSLGVIYPEFATCGCKMEPFAAPFFQHLCDLFSVYAVFRVLRKYTYIYDLHENFDLSFDVF